MNRFSFRSELLAQAFDVLPEAIAVIDEEIRVQALNTSAYKFLNVSEEHVPGVLLEELTPGLPIRDLTEALKAKKEAMVPVQGYHRFGNEKEQFLLRGELKSMGRQKENDHFVLVIRDIEKWEGGLRSSPGGELSWEKGMLMIAHDLRGPVRIVQKYAELFRNKYWDWLDEEGKELLWHLSEQAERSGRMVRDSLYLLDLDKAREQRQQVSLKEIVEEVRQELKPDMEKAGAMVSIGELPVIRGQKSKLVQLFRNLFDNALKFRRRDPLFLSVNASHKGIFWWITVKDNGQGIHGVEGDDLFRPFSRQGAKDHEEGIGMGLTIVQKVVHDHGGKVGWYSNEEGPGVSFYFTLPSEPGQ